MDLRFQVPMQHCSLYHCTLLPSPVTSTTGWCFCFGSISSFFLELFLHSSPVAYGAPNDLGSSSFYMNSTLELYTWTSPDGQYWNQIDYILCSQIWRSCMLLLLSHFSHVWLCATPKTAAHQAPLFLRFSRQEHWSGLPFPPPMHESEKGKWSRSVVSDS